VGNPFSRSGGGKRCFEVISRYRRFGVVPYLIVPPINNTSGIGELLPSLTKNGVKLIGLDLSLEYAQKRKIFRRAKLPGYAISSVLYSKFSKRVARLTKDVKFDFIIGHHELGYNSDNASNF
jgi:hypothetical protein